MNFSTSANLGDCLWCLQFLRRLGGHHAFYCKSEYMGQLRELMADTLVEIGDVNDRPPDSEDCWIANARFEQQGVRYGSTLNIIAFVQQYMNHLGGLAGTPAPVFTDPKQFLFELPRPNFRVPQFDVLVVNAQPTSGQVPEFDNAHLNDLIARLAIHYSVITTNPTTARNALTYDATILRIAELSCHCSLIIGVATGPIWATFNTRNASTPRHILLSPQWLDYGPTVPIANHANVNSVQAALERTGWL